LRKPGGAEVRRAIGQLHDLAVWRDEALSVVKLVDHRIAHGL